MDLIRQERPRILFFSETLCDMKQLESLKLKVGFHNCFVVSKSNTSRGVAPIQRDKWMLTLVLVEHQMNGDLLEYMAMQEREIGLALRLLCEIYHHRSIFPGL